MISSLKRLFALSAVTGFLSAAAWAYPIEDLSLYEKVYLDNAVINRPVLIIDIDYQGQRVKVQEEDGFSKWVSADRIMSKTENTIEVISQAMGVALIAECVYQVPDCDSNKLGQMLHYNEYRLGDPFPKKGGGTVSRSARTKSSSPRRGKNGVPDFMDPDAFSGIPGEEDLPPAPAPSVSTSPASSSTMTVEDAMSASEVGLFAQNDCHEQIWLDYAIKTSSFERAGAEQMTLLPGERKAITLGSYSKFHNSAELYYDASSISYVWRADADSTIGGVAKKYRKAVTTPLNASTRLFTLTCTN
jgi:hypothetical protein